MDPRRLPAVEQTLSQENMILQELFSVYFEVTELQRAGSRIMIVIKRRLIPSKLLHSLCLWCISIVKVKV